MSKPKLLNLIEDFNQRIKSDPGNKFTYAAILQNLRNAIRLMEAVEERESNLDNKGGQETTSL